MPANPFFLSLLLLNLYLPFAAYGHRNVSSNSTISSTSGDRRKILLTKLHLSLRFNCTSSNQEPSLSRVNHWLLPDLSILDPPRSNRSFSEAWSHSGVHVHEDGQELRLTRMEPSNLGDYFCYFETTENRSAYSRITVLLHEPGLWELYQRNIMIGGIAAGAMFAVSTLLCIISSLRWKDPGGIRVLVSDEPYRGERGSSKLNTGYDGEERCERRGAEIEREQSAVNVVKMKMKDITASSLGSDEAIDGYSATARGERQVLASNRL